MDLCTMLLLAAILLASSVSSLSGITILPVLLGLQSEWAERTESSQSKKQLHRQFPTELGCAFLI